MKRNKKKPCNSKRKEKKNKEKGKYIIVIIVIILGPRVAGLPLLEDGEETRGGYKLAVGDDEHLQRLLVLVLLHVLAGRGSPLLVALACHLAGREEKNI